MEKLEIYNEIVIQASVKYVWDVLTKSEYTKMYMFGCEAVSNWQEGSPLLWKGSWEGKEMVFLKGAIVKIVPYKLVLYTVFDPNSKSLKDVPENYLSVSYELSVENSQTKLVVTQGDYNRVGDGEKRYQESYNGGEGWNLLLIQIKQIAEGL
jgi:uncharacterized protein YndB with AHSA1/START domain